MAAMMRQPQQHAGPSDYHNPMADADEETLHNQSNQLRRESQLENDAFERGRMQGEMEAVRRLEAEGGRKTFNDTTVVNQQGNINNVVEIERLTKAQKAAAVFGELCSIGYIVVSGQGQADRVGGSDEHCKVAAGAVAQLHPRSRV